MRPLREATLMVLVNVLRMPEKVLVSPRRVEEAAVAAEPEMLPVMVLVNVLLPLNVLLLVRRVEEAAVPALPPMFIVVVDTPPHAPFRYAAMYPAVGVPSDACLAFQVAAEAMRLSASVPIQYGVKV